ncbi:hypothetical protein [Gorillibacterium sp. sgz5001074]|uniref:hypothetical protein n=1 Tax=Gorillibacterium sp. sgz5001074 TaxID=3446695 RepID=UPI003F67AFD0
MRRRFSLSDYIVFGLLAIGILSAFVTHPAPFIIPILVFGTIFLLYKFPPARWRRRGRTTVKRGADTRHRDRERRKANFRVIYGNKPDSEDDPPRYH